MRLRFTMFIVCLALATLGATLNPGKVWAQSYVTAVVQPGDTLAKLAGRYCTNWQTVYDINRQTIGPNPNQLAAGMVLTVPNYCGGAVAPPVVGGVYDRGPTTHASGPYRAPYYTVAWGDTLYSIANRFGLSVAVLQQTNNVGGGLNAGQVLTIPGGNGGATQLPQPPVVDAERVYFDSGGISATRTGIIYNGGAKRYILGGQAGRVMEIGTRSHGDPLVVTVTQANGVAVGLNGPNGGVENNLWTPLPVTGDYIVTISPVRLPEGPQLAFDITFIIQ
ncbi:MAG: LysM peptidoglycan-binding domain-containing protein [Caldilineaceae bacterium]